MTAKTKRILTVLLAILGVAAFVAPAVAWFASYWRSGGAGMDTGFNTGMPDVTLWMYYSTSDGAADTTAEEWREYNAKNGLTISDPNVLIPKVEVDKTQETYEYVYESLHFGKVDNLVSIRDDNKIYMRFEFNLKDHGANLMEIRLQYNTSGYNYTKGSSVLDSFGIYKMDADPGEGNTKPEDKKNAAWQDLYGTDNMTGDNILKYDEENPAAMQFARFKYALSADGTLKPGTDGFASLNFSEYVPIGCGRHDGACPCTCKVKDCEECKDGKHSLCKGAAATDSTEAIAPCTACDANKCGYVRIDKHTEGLDLTDGKYYLYVELSPLLDAFSMQENILDYFVPSYMLFDLKFEIEIG
jgi:hypothetical protein